MSDEQSFVLDEDFHFHSAPVCSHVSAVLQTALWFRNFWSSPHGPRKDWCAADKKLYGVCCKTWSLSVDRIRPAHSESFVGFLRRWTCKESPARYVLSVVVTKVNTQNHMHFCSSETSRGQMWHNNNYTVWSQSFNSRNESQPNYYFAPVPWSPDDPRSFMKPPVSCLHNNTRCLSDVAAPKGIHSVHKWKCSTLTYHRSYCHYGFMRKRVLLVCPEIIRSRRYVMLSGLNTWVLLFVLVFARICVYKRGEGNHIVKHFLVVLYELHF